jgi:hypothetical protein
MAGSGQATKGQEKNKHNLLYLNSSKKKHTHNKKQHFSNWIQVKTKERKKTTFYTFGCR